MPTDNKHFLESITLTAVLHASPDKIATLDDVYAIQQNWQYVLNLATEHVNMWQRHIDDEVRKQEKEEVK